MLLGTFCFSCKGILIKLLYPFGADSLVVIGWRMSFVLPLYLIIIWYRYPKLKAYAFPLKNWAWIGLLGCTGYYLAAYLDFSGLQYISAGLERVVVFLYPTFVVLINMLRERKWCSPRVMGSLMLSYFGVIIVYSADLDSFGPDQSKGAMLVLVSAFVFGLYVVYADVWMKRVRSVDFTSVAMVAASILTLSHAWSVYGVEMLKYPMEFYAIAACLGFFCTFVPSYMISYGIKQVGSNQASIFACLGPAFTILVAYFTLGESFGLWEMLGMAMTILASLLISKKQTN